MASPLGSIWARCTSTERGCLEWQGCRTRSGYGQVKRRRKVWKVSRFVYLMVHGYLPPDLEVRHTCDNPPCCNPAHLVLGTSQDNSDDMVSRRRQARGERSGTAKLLDSSVACIKAEVAKGRLQREVALDFGVTQSAVSLLCSGKRRVTCEKLLRY